MKYQYFNHISVPGDGDCFFHSLATIFSYEIMNKKPDNIEKKSFAIRRRVMRWLENNLDFKLSTGLTIRDEVNEAINYEIIKAKEKKRKPNYKDINGYFHYMEKPGSYAGQIEIYGVSNIYKRNVRTYSHIKKKFSNIGLGYIYDDTKNIDDIYLYHNLGKTKQAGLHHFEPLIIKKSLKKNDKSIKKKSVKKKNVKKNSLKRKSLKKKSSKRKSLKKKSLKRKNNVKKKRSKRRNNNI